MKRSPIKRSGSLQRFAGIKPASSKRKTSNERHGEERLIVFTRDGRCLLDHLQGERFEQGVVPPCFGRWTFHHLRKASALGKYRASNGACLCAGHNTWVETAPDLAHMLGLVVRNGEDHEEAAARRREHNLIPKEMLHG